MSSRLSDGQTAIVVAVAGKVVGLIFAADTVRPAASSALSDLRRRGLAIRVASGDRMEAVHHATAAAQVPRELIGWGMTPGEAVGCSFKQRRNNVGVFSPSTISLDNHTPTQGMGHQMLGM